MITEDIKKKIRDVVGAENALDSDLDRFGYSYDASFVPLFPANKPELVVRPATTEEVSKIMAIASEHGIPVLELEQNAEGLNRSNILLF